MDENLDLLLERWTDGITGQNMSVAEVETED